MDLLLGSLSEAELAIVREADPDRLAGLDEDALIELHTRVRRARNKHVKVYRRRAATRVPEAGGRGKAHAQNSRKRAKAEVFEVILATVSRHLALAAQASAESLEAERHAEERTARGVSSEPPAVPKLHPQRKDRRPQSVELTKRHASTRAQGARRQARKDSR
ncbi:hypothetical protein AB0F81_19685 [Actinoplanes sp. NPDC024001]|uniref:hypothetical protein n=1 Tax=Actinoplanes sp. NPDC024001 TaxID=3154598 RepID=UPI0033F5749B